MTTQERLINELTKRGMFESQAKEVLELAKPKIESIIEDYKITWNSSSDDYPNSIYNVWFMTVKSIALKWINENKPEAWFKPMFQ